MPSLPFHSHVQPFSLSYITISVLLLNLSFYACLLSFFFNFPYFSLSLSFFACFHPFLMFSFNHLYSASFLCAIFCLLRILFFRYLHFIVCFFRAAAFAVVTSVSLTWIQFQNRSKVPYLFLNSIANVSLEIESLRNLFHHSLGITLEFFIFCSLVQFTIF